ncbi:MAG: SAM-dependent methyltransferase [Candidatus Omnitrophota bacterium]
MSLPQGVGDFDGVVAIPYGISVDGTQVTLTATTRLLNQDDFVFKGALIRDLEELSSSVKVGEVKPSVLVIGAGAGPLIADYHARFGNDLDITFMNKERIQISSIDLKSRLPEAFGNVTDAELDGFQAYLADNILIHDVEQGLTQGSIIEGRKFDRIIVSSRTLEYMRDPLKVIHDIKSHLRVGGEAFINELLFLENEKIGGILIEGGLSLRDFFNQYNLDGNRPEFRVEHLFGDVDDRYYGLHIINLNPANNILPAYKIQSQTPIYGSEADMRIQGSKTIYYNTAPPIAPGADPARLAANLTPIEMAVDLTEALSDFGDEGILRDNREAVAIFLNGLHASKPSYFDGRRLLMLGSTKLYPGIRLDDEGREVFTLTGMDDILAEFPIGVNEAEEIAKKHQSEVRALNQKYVHGSAIAYVLAERESRRGYETLVNRVDASGIRQAIPKAVILKSSIIDLDMPRALLQQQLRLFIATFKKIQQAAPSTTFHFDAGFVGYADAIKAISQEYGIDSFVSLEEPTATIQVIIDSLSVVDVNGILVDIDQIQANELALGLPKAIYQGLKEAALFTNVETKQLDFESSDPIEITRLRHQRNESSKEPIESDNEYIELISGSMSITRRQRHIWNAIIPIPMDYMLKAAQRTIQQTVQST